MKAKSFIFLLIVNLIFITSYNHVQAQNRPYDRQAFMMLKEFYTAYITEWSKLTTPINLTKLNAIQRKYCTASLLSKIKAQLKSGQLDSDPFLQAQDVDISWLKTLSFNRDSRILNSYTASYIDSVSNEKVIIHLTIIKQGDNFKIMSIR